jgi:uncharacterized membrane protein
MAWNQQALTFVAVPRVVLVARKGNVEAHRFALLQLFWLALVSVGLFNSGQSRF